MKSPKIERQKRHFKTKLILGYVLVLYIPYLCQTLNKIFLAKVKFWYANRTRF